MKLFFFYITQTLIMVHGHGPAATASRCFLETWKRIKPSTQDAKNDEDIVLVSVSTAVSVGNPRWFSPMSPDISSFVLWSHGGHCFSSHKKYSPAGSQETLTELNNGIEFIDNNSSSHEFYCYRYLSNEKNPGWLGCIGDYTTQVYRDCNKSL